MRQVRIVPFIATAVVALTAAAGADAAQIVFSSNRADDERELYVVDRDGGGEHRITFNDVLERQPVFSPDGSRIAFAGLRDGSWDIYTTDASGGDLQQLTVDEVRDDYPRWTADGRITYQRGSEPCPCSAWIIDADGGNAEQIPIAGNVLTPEPSPHGQRLAYASDADGRYALYVSSLKGRGARRVTEPGAGFGDFMPRWSPSGNELAFLRNLEDVGQPNDLYAVRANGNDLRQLTSTDRFEYFVAWNGNDELDFAAAPPFRLWAFDLPTGNEEELKTWPTAPLDEGFEDGIRDASLWHQISDPGSAIGAVGGRLVVSIAGDAVPGGPFNQIAAHWGSQCSLPGDFDYQVDYELLTWPQHGGYFAALNAFFGDAAVARMSTPFDPPFDESYGAWRGGADFAFNGINTTDLDGTMRLVRSAGTVFAYYRSGDSDWNLIFTGGGVTGVTVVGMGLSTPANLFGHMDGSVAYDNFRLNSGELSCPSWWSDIWVDVG